MHNFTAFCPISFTLVEGNIILNDKKRFYLKFLRFCLFLSLNELRIVTGALSCEVYLRKTSLQTPDID